MNLDLGFGSNTSKFKWFSYNNGTFDDARYVAAYISTSFNITNNNGNFLLNI